MTLYASKCPRCRTGAIEVLPIDSEARCISCGGVWYANPGSPRTGNSINGRAYIEYRLCSGAYKPPLKNSIYRTYRRSRDGYLINVAVCISCKGRVELLLSGVAESHTPRKPLVRKS